MVFRLAIVEDEKQDSDLLQSHIHHFFTENCPDDSFQATVFDNAGVFIEQYRPDYDLIEVRFIFFFLLAQFRESGLRGHLLSLLEMIQFCKRSRDDLSLISR